MSDEVKPGASKAPKGSGAPRTDTLKEEEMQLLETLRSARRRGEESGERYSINATFVPGRSEWRVSTYREQRFDRIVEE